MPFIINNQYEEVVNGPFTIKLSIYNNDLAVLITDENATIQTQFIKGKMLSDQVDKQDNAPWQNQRSKPCIVERNLKFIVDRGTFKENIICRVPPPVCPPPPCDDRTDLEQHRVAEETIVENTYTENEEEQDSNINILQFTNQQVTVFGFSKIGNFDRSVFHTVTYQYRIPESSFAPGFNLLQIYLEDEDDATSLIYSKGIERTDVEENTAPRADAISNLPEASSRKTIRGKSE